MPRRKKVVKRDLLPDPKFRDVMVAKFINNLMLKGKKSLAEGIFYDSLEIVSEKTGSDEPLEVFKKALSNITPMVEVRSRRIGGSTYQVPIEISGARRQALAIRWLIHFSRQGSGKTMASKLAKEIVAASNGEGAAVEKKKNTHKMADANKAFAHFRY